MEHKLLSQLLSRSPLWAIRPEAIYAALAAQPGQPPKPIGLSAPKTAVVPIQGVLTKDGPAWYGSNYQTIAASVEKAVNDPDVKHIILAVDSPGGEVTGLPETAAVLAAAAKVKPVSAIVEGTSASAAYWLTSQASDVTLTPSGEVGSVGVRMMHVDVSKALEDEGVKITELYSGDYKTEWSPYKPLSEDAQADMQTRLQRMHGDFVSAIASGRAARLSATMHKSRMGEGRMFSSSDALSHGLVDRVASVRDAYRAIVAKNAVPGDTRRARLQLERARI